mgnify:CR=1 FL=1
MGIILNMDSVGDYNSFLGQETLHPLVSVVDFSRVPPLRHCLLYTSPSPRDA